MVFLCSFLLNSDWENFDRKPCNGFIKGCIVFKRFPSHYYTWFLCFFNSENGVKTPLCHSFIHLVHTLWITLLFVLFILSLSVIVLAFHSVLRIIVHSLSEIYSIETRCIERGAGQEEGLQAKFGKPQEFTGLPSSFVEAQDSRVFGSILVFISVVMLYRRFNKPTDGEKDPHCC